jgi:hypothetical protein
MKLNSTSTKTVKAAGSYTTVVKSSQQRIYRSWIEMDLPVNPPRIVKKMKGKENALYNSVALSPMMDKDKWQWQRYFKAKNRADACRQFGEWISSVVRKVYFPTVRSKPLNEIAFVDNPNDELFYSSDMDLRSDNFSFMPSEDVVSVVESSNGQLEFNQSPISELQRYSLKRPKNFDSSPYFIIEKNLYEHKKTGYYFVFYGKERYSLLTDDRQRAKSKLKKVLENLRKKLDPFHHEQDVVQRTKNQELKRLVNRLKKSKETKQMNNLISRTKGK